MRNIIISIVVVILMGGCLINALPGSSYGCFDNECNYGCMQLGYDCGKCCYNSCECHGPRRGGYGLGGGFSGGYNGGFGGAPYGAGGSGGFYPPRYI